MNETSGELLERCRRRDQRAWEEVVDRFSGLVYAIARSCGLQGEACDDVAQTVFANLARSIDAIRDAEALPAWIGTSARRECWRIRKRQRGAEPLIAERDALQEVEQAGERMERAFAVRAGLIELGGRCQQLLTRIFGAVGEPDYKAIGEELGMPIGSIGPTRARCLAKLAGILKGKGLGEEARGGLPGAETKGAQTP